jgi:hypothetical protein
VSSPILARADALMHRRRQSEQESDEIPVLTDSIDDDDIPVLTEVETTLENALSQVEDAEIGMEPVEAFVLDEPIDILEPQSPEPSAIDLSIRNQLIHELTCRIEERIQAALPEIIGSTVKEFLAEQDKIAKS